MGSGAVRCGKSHVLLAWAEGGGGGAGYRRDTAAAAVAAAVCLGCAPPNPADCKFDGLQVCYDADDQEPELLLPLNFVHFGSKPPEVGSYAQALPPPWQPPGAAAPAPGAAAGRSAAAVGAGAAGTKQAAVAGSASAVKADAKAAAAAGPAATAAAGGGSAPPKAKAAPVAKRPAVDLLDDFEEKLENLPM